MKSANSANVRKMRLDARLVETGAFQSRARAQEAIRAGLVRVGGARASKASLTVRPGDRVEVLGDVHDYVSRGGVKLAAGLDHFGISPAGAMCLDLGASTGGFTDVLLRRGAGRVYAIDVGAGQLAPAIAAAPRVFSLEKTHAKDISTSIIPDPIDLLVVDVSFISLKKALPPAMGLVRDGGRLVALVKPQFEVGKGGLGKGGIVRAGEARAAAEDVAEWLRGRDGWSVLGLTESPIAGGDGNREHLLGAFKTQ